MRRRILLWRHGQTSWNAASRFQGQRDIDLDDVGRVQAERTGELLARLRPCAIVSSDLRRASDTAQALARRTGLSVTLDPRLRETYAGAWQGLTSGEIDARFADVRRAWRAGQDVRPGGDGELRSEVGTRVASALLEHVEALPSDALLVAATHGGAASSGLHTLLQVPRAAWPVISGLGNCHWSVVEQLASGSWVLEEHNAGSLPEEVVGDET